MKKNLSALFLFLCTCLTSYSQEKEVTLQKGLKLNVNLQFNERGHTLGNLAPAFVLENRHGNSHTFELNKIGFIKEIKTERDKYGNSFQTILKRRSLGLWYQYTHYFFAEERLLPYIGGAFLSLWGHNKFETGENSLFPYQHLGNANAFEFVPGARWRITERMGLDMAVVFYMLVHEFSYDKVENPYLPIRAQQNFSNQIYSRPFDFFLSRLGFYVKL